MPDSALKIRIESDMKDAMRARDKQRLGVIRLIMADYKRVEIDERIKLDDERITLILDKMAKQRRDSIDQFSKAERQDLVDQETFELKLITEYLPEQLDEAEIDRLLDEAIVEAGASSMKEMGQVMAILRPKVQGKADMGAVSTKLKGRLSPG